MIPAFHTVTHEKPVGGLKLARLRF